MKKLSLILATVTLIVATSCKNDKKNNEMNGTEGQTELNMEDSTNVEDNMMKEEEMMNEKKVVIDMQAKSGSKLTGQVVFTEENGEVTMKATINGLAEGTHAIHIHETADCSSPDGKSAGGHWNPTFAPHAKWGAEEGYHKGDIGNFEVNAEGVGEITFTTNEWCIGCGDEKKDILGHAVIVHDGVDDFTSQPSGNAGSRVGCGIIKM